MKTRHSRLLVCNLAPLAICFALLSLPASMLAQSQMKQMAVRTATGPLKLDVEVQTPTVPLNSAIYVKVYLRNANNEAVSWDRPSTIKLVITYPSKKVSEQRIFIPAGQSSGEAKLEAAEYGISQIHAAEASDSLLSGGNSVFVVAVKQQKKGTAKSRVPGVSMRESLRLAKQPRMVLASLANSQQPQGSSVDAAEQPNVPQLLLENSTGKAEVLADGKDFARIRVFYMTPDGGPARSDIVLWMSWSNGNFSPQPLVIHKGEMVAEGQLVSMSPLEATVELVKSAPLIPIRGASQLQVTFSPPIYGFGPATSESIVRMSLIDREPLIGCFFDDQGRCIQTDRMRHVNVSSTNPTLHVDPESADITAKEGTATFYLEPTWSGSAYVEMWMPGYNKQRIAIEISLWLVLGLCLAGGLVGGIAARDALKGSTSWRCFIGTVGSIVLVWLCVFTVVPSAHSTIAHSLVSVLVVGIVGGYAGTRVLDLAAKKLGVI